MKILQVCSANSIGGGEYHVIDLTRGLIERGHELHLAIRPNSPMRAELAAMPIHWHELKLRNALDIFSAKHLTKLIVANKIEVVHAHLARDYPIAGWATRRLPVRLLLTRHHYNPIRSNRLYENAIRHTTKWIAVSATVQQALAKAFPTLKEKIVIVPNWLRYKTLRPRAEARNRLDIHRPFAVAVIGQITPLKRQDLFLNAIQLLRTDHLATETDFFMIGAANEKDRAYEQSLRQQAHDSGLRDAVHFTGVVTDLPQYLTAFDVIVAPSENEGFSLATIEAMKAGCVVVASKVSGFSEIITHNETGLLFSPGNVEELATNLRTILLDSQLRQKLAAAAQTLVGERYDRERILDQIERIYQAQ